MSKKKKKKQISGEPDITVLLLSYNKFKYVRDGINSVLNQDYPNFNLWVIENSVDDKTRLLVKSLEGTDPRLTIFYDDFTDEERINTFMNAYLVNKYWEKATTEFVCWIADDDLYRKDFLHKVHKELIANPDAGAMYCASKFMTENADGSWKEYAVQQSAISGARFGPGTRSPKDMIDSCGALFRRSLLDELDKPWWPEGWDTFFRCDTLFLEKFAQKFWIMPIPSIKLIHRCTPISCAQTNTKHIRERKPEERVRW